MNWIKVDEEIFDHVGKRISEGVTVPIADQRPNKLNAFIYSIQLAIGND